MVRKGNIYDTNDLMITVWPDSVEIRHHDLIGSITINGCQIQDMNKPELVFTAIKAIMDATSDRLGDARNEEGENEND